MRIIAAAALHGLIFSCDHNLEESAPMRLKVLKQHCGAFLMSFYFIVLALKSSFKLNYWDCWSCMDALSYFYQWFNLDPFWLGWPAKKFSFCPVVLKKKKLLFLCVRMFVVQQIPDSNLLMLVVQADCDCSRQYPPITMDPKEVKYILSCYIILATTMYRIEYPLFIMIQDCKTRFRGQVEGWSQPPCWPLKTEDHLFWTSQRASSFQCCSSLTPSHIMPQLNVTGWGHRRFAGGLSPATPTTPRSASHSLISKNWS